MRQRMNRAQRELQRALAQCTTYTAWCEIARAADRESGFDAWRDDNESNCYDATLVNERLQAMRRARASGRAGEAMACVHEALASTIDEVTAPALYQQALAGPKWLVTSFVDELVATLTWLGDPELESVRPTERLRLLEKENRAFGSLALMLSGGGGFGWHHLGVASALLDEGLLPSVISGSSAGAMVAAWLCCHGDDALRAGLVDPSSMRFAGLRFADLSTALSNRALFDPGHMHTAFRDTIGVLTFEEAARKSGRFLNISVSPTEAHQRPRLLSALTSPTVLVSTAVLASCALPIAYPPATLVQREDSGMEAPYLPNARWIDGSLHADVPMRSVGRLNNVTCFVVSQANPYAGPWLDGRLDQETGSFSRLAASALRTQGAHLATALGKLTSSPTLKRGARLTTALLSQEYSGDIDLRARAKSSMLLKLFSNPTPALIEAFILDGMRVTWPHLERIRDQTRVRRALAESVARLRAHVRTPVRAGVRPGSDGERSGAC